MKKFKTLLLILSLFQAISGFSSSVDPLILKANFVLKFVPYIEFPTKFDTFKIVYYGKKDRFEIFSKVFSGKSYNGVHFEVVRAHSEENIPEAQIIFIGTDKFPTQLKSGKALIISDDEDGIEKGAMINFLTIGDSVSFEINNHRSQAQGIMISSRLLNLAKRIIK